MVAVHHRKATELMTTDQGTQAAVQLTDASSPDVSPTGVSSSGTGSIGVVGTVLADLRAWLSQHLQDPTIALTDDLLGMPLLNRLFHLSALTLRDAKIDLSAADAVGLIGIVDLLGATDVGVELQ